MKMRVISSFMVVGLVWGATAVRAADPKTADEVVARYIKAIGGRKALDAVKTQRRTGKNSMAGGMEMPFVMEFKKPNKFRAEFTMQGMTAIQAFDGTTGWMVIPFQGSDEPQKMPPEQAEEMKDQADMNGPLVDYARKGYKLELEGKDQVDGTDAYKLKLTKKDGTVEYYFLDAEYFLPIKIKGKREVQGTTVEYEATPGDYKKVGDLLLAHSFKQQAIGMPMTATMTFDKIELNVDIPDTQFEMPKPKPDKAPESKPGS